MPFIRLSDNYIDHPKFLALSDAAFRLWHEGMSFCRKHLTDGVIPSSALKGFRYYRPARVAELSMPYQPDAHPLWQLVAQVGFQVHDYLDWNDSREEEHKRLQESRARTEKWRLRRTRDALPIPSQNALPDAYVPDRIGDLVSRSEGVQGKPTSQDLAGRVFETYGRHWKRVYRHECSLNPSPLEIMKLEGHLERHPIDLVLNALSAFFASPEPFIVKARHPLPLFLRDPLKYLAHDPVPIATRPRGCRHEPACPDDVTHTRRDMADRQVAS